MAQDDDHKHSPRQAHDHDHTGHEHTDAAHDHDDGEHGHDHEGDHDQNHEDNARGYGHSHGHGRGHSHAPASFGRAFALGITLNTIFVIVEVIYGLLSHSLALVADAGHNLSDVLGLFLAWGATVLARRAATKRYSYGWQRSSVLAALFNAIFLLVSVGAIGWEAIEHLREPSAVDPNTIIWVSTLGIFVNAGTALMFMSGRKGDLNIRGAFAHMAADAVIAAGVVVAGIVIKFTGWNWLDPVVSLILVAAVIYGTWSLLKDSFKLAIDATPENINPDAVGSYLESHPAVVSTHHMHIWGLSTTETALTVHMVLQPGTTGDQLLAEITHELKTRFQIGHATIQFESADAHPCQAQDCA